MPNDQMYKDDLTGEESVFSEDETYSNDEYPSDDEECPISDDEEVEDPFLATPQKLLLRLRVLEGRISIIKQNISIEPTTSIAESSSARTIPISALNLKNR